MTASAAEFTSAKRAGGQGGTAGPHLSDTQAGTFADSIKLWSEP
jgi:hypothetical protein